ncbi:NAD(P)/FAD-dependent oxidoreductase [Longicatena caecimuris]|uniref:NAD(P)/FAD-dependent oxidoreductase n=1 Tax=Longicatena caecimuris TaxID=1796635 RepID=UPI0022DED878|nr:FAD-dependent oxidoreductase [Longicatena caecimuris]
MSEMYDVVIIGGGPAGLAAAIYAGRAQRKTLLIEKGSYGGRINDTREIRNYPGTISDSGAGLMEKFKEHARSYATNEFKRTTVTGIEKATDGSFVIHTKRRGDFLAQCVLLDIGTKPRILGIPGEVEFAGHGVAYCATCDAEFFKGKEIYVLGAGDQAIEEADYLTNFASKVSIIVLHEEGHLDCNEVAAETAFHNPKIHFVWNSTLQEIKGKEEVESLVIKNVVTNESKEVKADGIFFFVGMVPQTEFVKDLVACDKKGYIKVNEKKETNVAGIYAIGDCTQTFLRQVVTSAADGAIAATASERYVKEKKQIDAILTPDSGKVAFLFYNPYDSAQIDALTKMEEKLGGTYHVIRQDITRQSLLYERLQMHNVPAAAYYENGQVERIEESL